MAEPTDTAATAATDTDPPDCPACVATDRAWAHRYDALRREYDSLLHDALAAAMADVPALMLIPPSDLRDNPSPKQRAVMLAMLRAVGEEPSAQLLWDGSKKLIAWDGTDAAFWAAVVHVREHADTEGDHTVLCEVLALAGREARRNG